MLHGWHGHNGVSLGNPRLGFVCTGQTVNGDPGLEGYYFEYDRPLAEHERVRFAGGERMPAFNPVSAPKLDSASWPEARLKKVERSYAMEYIRSLLPTMQELFGAEEGGALVARTARLIGLQFHEETVALLGIEDRDAVSFARYLTALAAAQGETIARAGATVTQTGWRLMQGVTLHDEPSAFHAWNALWEGAAAAHNRELSLVTRREGDRIVWHCR
jgi:hypothetical protein